MSRTPARLALPTRGTMHSYNPVWGVLFCVGVLTAAVAFWGAVAYAVFWAFKKVCVS